MMGGYSLFYDYYCGVASHHTHTRGNTAHLKQLPIFGKRRPQSYNRDSYVNHHDCSDDMSDLNF